MKRTWKIGKWLGEHRTFRIYNWYYVWKCFLQSRTFEPASRKTNITFNIKSVHLPNLVRFHITCMSPHIQSCCKKTKTKSTLITDATRTTTWLEKKIWLTINREGGEDVVHLGQLVLVEVLSLDIGSGDESGYTLELGVLRLPQQHDIESVHVEENCLVWIILFPVEFRPKDEFSIEADGLRRGYLEIDAQFRNINQISE
jgi:hypothetical protein